MATISAKDIQDMVRHWLATPVCGYLASGYGSDVKSLLQLPFSDGAPETFLAKMREDIPILQSLPPGALNLYAVRTPPDKTELIVGVLGVEIPVPRFSGA